MVAELQPDPAAPAAAAYPNTLPAAAALFGTEEAARYSRFLEQLQKAAWQDDDAAGAGAGAGASDEDGSAAASVVDAADVGGLPSLLQLTGLLAGCADGGAGAGGSSPGSAAGGVEVTGPSAPLALVLSHRVDAAQRVLVLRCAVHNRTMEAIKGVEVRWGVGVGWGGGAVAPQTAAAAATRWAGPAEHPPSASIAVLVLNPALSSPRLQVELALGGPVAPGHRRPLTFRLEPLPPAGSTSWEAELRVTGFGWPSVQPSVLLPVKASWARGVALSWSPRQLLTCACAAPARLPATNPTTRLPACSSSAQLPGGQEASMRCKPYGISPLQLLAPPTHAITPAEFYQLWQALPHRAQLSATASEPGAGGLQRVLSAMGGGAMLCVLRGAAAAHGSAHAAFHGASWDGQRIACVVTGAVPLAPAEGAALAPPQHARLQFFFRSESGEVVAHVQVGAGPCLRLDRALAPPVDAGDAPSASSLPL